MGDPPVELEKSLFPPPTAVQSASVKEEAPRNHMGELESLRGGGGGEILICRIFLLAPTQDLC